MKWQNQVVFPLLIINASGTFTGLFVYSPNIGAGNLIASITAQAGTDPYGNAYKAGITSYFSGGGQPFAGLVGGQVDWGSLNAGTFITNDGVAVLIDALFATAAPTVQIGSPGTGHGRVWANFIGGSQDGSTQARALVIDTTADTTSATAALLEVNGTTSFRTLASLATQTQSNFAAERVIGTYTLNANEPQPGRSYTFWGAGVAGDTLTPTLQIRIRVGGLTGALIGDTGVMTCRTAAGMAYSWNGRLVFTATGASSTIDSDTQINEEIIATSGGGHPRAGQGTTGPSTLVAVTIVVTAQWSVANAANTISTSSGSLERIQY